MQLKRALVGRIQQDRQFLLQLMKSPSMRHPVDRINEKKMDLELLKRNLENGIEKKLETEKGKLSLICGKMDALSPLMVLSRGYSITRDIQENIVKSVAQLQAGDELDIVFSDGTARCVTKQICSR